MLVLLEGSSSIDVLFSAFFADTSSFLDCTSSDLLDRALDSEIEASSHFFGRASDAVRDCRIVKVAGVASSRSAN